MIKNPAHQLIQMNLVCKFGLIASYFIGNCQLGKKHTLFNSFEKKKNKKSMLKV